MTKFKALKVLLVVLLLFSIPTESYAGSFLVEAFKYVVKGGPFNKRRDKSKGTANGKRGDEGKKPPLVPSEEVSVSDEGVEGIKLGDVTTEIKPKKISGRNVVIRRLSEVLLRDKKASAILVGDAGVGKSAIAEHFQYLIDEGKTVKMFKGTKLLELHHNQIFRDTKYTGQLESNVEAIIEEISDPKNSGKILVIDELEQVLESKNGEMFVKSLKGYMSGEMKGAKIICNLTPEAYEKHMTDPQLIRRLIPIYIDPPSDETVRSILHSLAENYQDREGIRPSDGQLEHILKLSKEHPKLGNPDVAVTMLGDAVKKTLSEIELGPEYIVKLRDDVSNWKIELNFLKEESKKRLSFSGPFFYLQKKYLDELIEKNEETIILFDRGLRKTKDLRDKLLENFEERNELYIKKSRKSKKSRD